MRMEATLTEVSVTNLPSKHDSCYEEKKTLVEVSTSKSEEWIAICFVYYCNFLFDLSGVDLVVHRHSAKDNIFFKQRCRIKAHI